MPPRISPATYPIAAAATALALEYDVAADALPEPKSHYFIPDPARPGQQPLFATEVEASAFKRVIAFDELTTPEQRESIRARAADLPRPAPLKNSSVGVRRARPQKTRKSQDQRILEFSGQEQVVSPSRSSLKCDAPVAPPMLRVQAALLDVALVALGCALCLTIYRLAGGGFPATRQALAGLAAALATVPAVYLLLWTWAGQDSLGMQRLGLRLVDFDGNPPTSAQRFYRLAGSVISLLAAGMGLIWACCDSDQLTWHDHISGTFPTVLADE